MKLSDLHAAYGLTVSIGYRTAAQRVDVYFPKDAFEVPVEIEAGPQRLTGALKLEKFTPDNPLDEWDMEISLNVPGVHDIEAAPLEPEAPPKVSPPTPPAGPEAQESSFLASPERAPSAPSSFTADVIPFHDEEEEQEGEPVFTPETRAKLEEEEKARVEQINTPMDADTGKRSPVKPAPKKAPKR